MREASGPKSSRGPGDHVVRLEDRISALHGEDRAEWLARVTDMGRAHKRDKCRTVASTRT